MTKTRTLRPGLMISHLGVGAVKSDPDAIRCAIELAFAELSGLLPVPSSPSMLDLFCGVGGWSEVFGARGWNCVGVDSADFGDSYPGRFVRSDVLALPSAWIDRFDVVLASPPCEDFARAWLPWLRGDHQPSGLAKGLLNWSVDLCDRPGRLVECSRFASYHRLGSVREGSYHLWGDVPLLIRQTPRGKTKGSGKRPDLRAKVPGELALSVAEWFEAGLESECAPLGGSSTSLGPSSEFSSPRSCGGSQQETIPKYVGR